MKMTPAHIAIICHEANRAFCSINGDDSQSSWYGAEEWQRQSAIKGAEFAASNPDAPASAQHDAWMKDKLDDGWKFGPLKDAAKKEHPCLVPFESLPEFQQKKDHLFKAIVKALHNSAECAKGE